ncbi:MAG: helix-turn-helix domain-containing protein [Micromonosporaceae bacterium]|nr:helix-turn-helix domain-containing protein [Micromonosporaceae bacterium]
MTIAEVPQADAPDDESLGARLHRLRVARGLTQKDVAGDRYSAAFVSTIESGRRRPSHEAIEYFADRLGVDDEELLTGRPAHAIAELRLALANARHAASTDELSEAVRQYTTVRNEAREADLPRIEAAALLGLARCAERGGDPTVAMRRLDEAEQRLVGEPLTELVPIIAQRARLLRLRGDLREAAYTLETTRERLERDGLNSPDALVQLSYGMVGVYMELGLPQRAAHAAEIALSLAGGVKDPELLAAMNVQVARTFLAQGRGVDAEAALDRAQAAYQQMDYKLEIAVCHWSRGFKLSRESRYADAEPELATARDMMRDLGSWYWAGSLASELATVLWRLGRPEEAITALDDAWRLADEEPQPTIALAEAHRLRGVIASEAGELELAERSFRVSMRLCLRAEAGPDTARTARLLGDLLRDSDRSGEALAVYRQGLLAAEHSSDELP